MKRSPLSLALSPGGQVYIDQHPDNNEFLDVHKTEKIHALFEGDHATGLLYLGVEDIDVNLSESVAYWQKFSRLFINKLCVVSASEDISQNTEVPYPSLQEFQDIIADAPFMKGAEYLSIDNLVSLWKGLQTATQQQLIVHNDSVQDFLNAHNPQWGMVGRVYFHLAENKASTENPFAFLATYTTRLSATTKAQHLPLGRALQNYSGQKQALLSLLSPIQKVAEQSSLINDMVNSGDIFKPQLWSPQEAFLFLQSIPIIEDAGIMVKVPDWWSPKKPSRAKVSVSIGEQKVSTMGLDALLDMDVNITLSDGETLTEEEWQAIQNSAENLVLIKGKWIEVDRSKLNDVLKHWTKIKAKVKKGGVSFSEAMRLLSGASYADAKDDSAITDSAEWSNVIAGDWLAKTLSQMRHPEDEDNQQIASILKTDLNATLRPYQLIGVNWLWLLYNLKLGGCLADDMGLGKTIQVLSFLLLIKKQELVKQPKLLVVPASLLGNWMSEIERFAPSMKIWCAHSSMVSSSELGSANEENIADYDLVITTYTFAQRLEWLQKIKWDVLVLDEAQLIKNPSAKQTRAIKSLKCQVRFALSGTPVENRLSDLWSLFDFTCPGLLGSSKSFGDYAKKNNEQKKHFYGAVRSLVSPYILRRLKSDKSIINDLPDKTEIKTYCSLSKRQIILYQQSLEELVESLKEADGMKRRGLVISYIMRFKQICNHPTQWLGYGDYSLQESGKFIRLREICEEIAAKQEKVLIFTQFKEIMPALHNCLSDVFGQTGLMLHGSTSIKERSKLVNQFNEDLGPPFFILSLKAGGTGLNLTKASHVIHFDRWWNPAVENQATDRAYRIGQRKNVLIHKFICRGTIEDKIDELIDSKKELSNQLLSAEKEISLTELSNEELIKIVSLDIHRVLEDN